MTPFKVLWRLNHLTEREKDRQTEQHKDRLTCWKKVELRNSTFGNLGDQVFHFQFAALAEVVPFPAWDDTFFYIHS